MIGFLLVIIGVGISIGYLIYLSVMKTLEIIDRRFFLFLFVVITGFVLKIIGLVLLAMGI
jgi:hypothetical protein